MSLSLEGYVLVDPRTGRVDQYDQRQRHTGHGYITPDIRRELLDEKLRDAKVLREPR